jgi:hypothetical protein
MEVKREWSRRPAEFPVRGFVQRHFRAEIGESERDGFSEITIGGIPDQPGAWVSLGPDNHGSNVAVCHTSAQL